MRTPTFVEKLHAAGACAHYHSVERRRATRFRVIQCYRTRLSGQQRTVGLDPKLLLHGRRRDAGGDLLHGRAYRKRRVARKTLLVGMRAGARCVGRAHQTRGTHPVRNRWSELPISVRGDAALWRDHQLWESDADEIASGNVLQSIMQETLRVDCDLPRRGSEHDAPTSPLAEKQLGRFRARPRRIHSP